MSKRAIVIGRNYCNILTTARALGEAGYEVEILKIFKTKPSPLKFLRLMKPDAMSKYVVSYKELIVGNNDNAIAQALIKNASSDKKLLFPVDDYACSSVDNSLDELSKHYYAPSVSGKARELARLMDKNEQKRVAEKYELPLLKSWLIKAENGSFDIPNDVIYPCFVKPNISMKSDKSKMKMCKDMDELSSLLTKYASQENFEMLVEEFADIKEEYSILGVSTGEKAFCGGMFKAIIGGNHERKGVALVGETVDSSRFNDIVQKCNSFVAGIGYKGLFDIDLIEDKNGKIYFVELNFRAGASTYALNQLGLNLFGAYADFVSSGKDIDFIETVNESKKFISEKVLMEELARGDISIGSVKKYMAMADIFFVKNNDDMKPYRYFKKFYLPTLLVRILYKLKG